MRLHRFLVKEPIGHVQRLSITDTALVHQFRNVFRFAVGGQVILIDNSGYEYLAMISSINRSEAVVEIVSKRESKNMPPKEVYLFASIIKKDKFEWVVEKGTELGVTHFVPVLSDRSEKKNLREDRLLSIIKEATEQSGRAKMPELHPIVPLETALKAEMALFAFHSEGEPFVYEKFYHHNPVGLFVGPEGGWTEREIFLFKKNNALLISLGGATLRAETAAIAAASLILLS